MAVVGGAVTMGAGAGIGVTHLPNPLHVFALLILPFPPPHVSLSLLFHLLLSPLPCCCYLPSCHPLLCPLHRPLPIPLVIVIIPPMIHSMSSCLQGWRWVVCHLSLSLLLGQHHHISWNGCHSGSTRSQGWVWWDVMVWLWSGMIRNGKGQLVERRVTPNKVEYPKRTQLGCPLSSYYVYILCYIYCRVFDHATGTYAYRCIHNTIFTCMRIIIPTITLRAFGVAFGL